MFGFKGLIFVFIKGLNGFLIGGIGILLELLQFGVFLSGMFWFKGLIFGLLIGLNGEFFCLNGFLMDRIDILLELIQFGIFLFGLM